MANEIYIVRRDSTLATGVTQITDLKPNTSRRSLTYDKVPQSGYVPAYPTSQAVTGNVAANVTTKVLEGLAIYFADVIDEGAAAGGNGLDATQSDAIAAAVLAISDAGTTLGTTELNAAIIAGGAAAGTTISGGGSLGSLTDVLKILSGGKYSVPAGTQVNGAAAFKASKAGSFDEGVYRQIYSTGALTLSFNEGDLATLVSQNKVALYDQNGTALS